MLGWDEAAEHYSLWEEVIFCPSPLSAFLGLPEQRSLADYWIVIKTIIKEVTRRELIPVPSRRVSTLLDNDFFML